MSPQPIVFVGDARTAALGRDDLDPENIVEGDPTVSSAQLLTVAGLEIGIWEITPGTVVDIEVDEVFIVLSGRARVDFADGASRLINEGSIVHLAAGDRTTWIVYETVRKFYVLLPAQATTEELS